MSSTNHQTLATATDPARRGFFERHGLKVTWQMKKSDEDSNSLAVKNHFIAMLGEYVGTVLFLIFALGGTNVANIPTTSVTGNTQSGQDGTRAAAPNTSNLLYIALCFGFSLAVVVWIFFRISGGLFNPAVSLAMVIVGGITPLRGALLTLSQILGGITGAAIIQVLTPGTLNVQTKLGGGASVVQGLFIEMFLTSLLMLAILFLAAEKHKATFIAPVGIGLALFVAELLGVYYTGGSLNPARSFGPAVVLKEFESYHWIYWLGPALGAVVAAAFYKLLKAMQYETVLGAEVDADNTAPHLPQKLKKDPESDAEKGELGSGPEARRTSTDAEIGSVGQPQLSNLEKSAQRLEERLNRIEGLLNRLVGQNQRPKKAVYSRV